MDHSALDAFVAAALRNQRIRFGDVRRLQRDVLPRGVTSVAEARTLLDLDRTGAKADPTWTSFVVGAVRDFVIDGRDTGAGVERARELRSVLGQRASRTELAIVREIALTTAQLGRPTNVTPSIGAPAA